MPAIKTLPPTTEAEKHPLRKKKWSFCRTCGDVIACAHGVWDKKRYFKDEHVH